MIKSAYIAQRLDLEAYSARRAMAECQRDSFQVKPFRGFRHATTRLRLVRDPGTKRVSPHQVFEQPGTLWIGCLPVRVHLECTEWSRNESELGLRPSHLKWPVGTEAYARAAVAILQAIAEELIAIHAIAEYRGAGQTEVLVRNAA